MNLWFYISLSLYIVGIFAVYTNVMETAMMGFVKRLWALLWPVVFLSILIRVAILLLVDLHKDLFDFLFGTKNDKG